MQWTPVEFDVTEIYVLARDGADGQFEVVETIPLGPAPLWRVRRIGRWLLGRSSRKPFASMPSEPYE